MFRPTESFTYPNASSQVDVLVDEVKRITKHGKPNAYSTLGDRPWNGESTRINIGVNPLLTRLDPGPRSGFRAEDILNDRRPIMRAVVIDFSAVATIDSTGIQSLVDARHQVNKYADREVEFHFANIISPWVRRALIAGGFGFGVPLKDFTEVSPVVAGNSSYSGSSSQQNNTEVNDLKHRVKNYITNTDYKDKRFQTQDEYDLNLAERGSDDQDHWGALISNDTPFFHLDIPDLSLLPPDDKKVHADDSS